MVAMYLDVGPWSTRGQGSRLSPELIEAMVRGVNENPEFSGGLIKHSSTVKSHKENLLCLLAIPAKPLCLLLVRGNTSTY